MRIGIVGGVERSEGHLHRIAEAAGHELEFHAGHDSYRDRIALEALVGRCDRIIIVTDVNSHAAVRGAREMARRRGCDAVVVRRFGPSRLASLLDGTTGC